MGLVCGLNTRTQTLSDALSLRSDADLNLGCCPKDMLEKNISGRTCSERKTGPSSKVQGIGEQNKLCRNILWRFDMATQSRLSRTHYLSPSLPNYVSAVLCHPRSNLQVIPRLQEGTSLPCTHASHPAPIGDSREQPRSTR